MGTLGSGLTGLGNVQTAGEPPGGGAGGRDIAANEWAHDRQVAISHYIPGLSWAWVKPNTIGPASYGATPTIGAHDANILGGGTYADQGGYVTLTGIIYTDLLTQVHAWCCRAMVNPPSARYASFGPSFNTTGANSVYTRLTSYAPYNGTKLCIEFFRPGAAGSTVVPTNYTIDGGEHSYALLQDSSGVWHCLVDDQEVGSTINIANVTSGNRVWASYGEGVAGTADVAIGELIYGWQAPTLLATPDAFSVRPGQRIGFIGDSYTAGSPNATFRWQQPLEDSLTAKFRTCNATIPTFVNLGVGGDTSTDVLARIAAINATGCDHYIHLYGLNDHFNHGGAPIVPATTQANYTAILNAIAVARPTSKQHVLSNLWDASEQRPRGIGPNDTLVDNSNAAIVAAVALQPTTRARYLNLIPRIYTSFSPVINPGNAAAGFLTQVDATHPAKTAGQNVISRCVFDRLTFSR